VNRATETTSAAASLTAGRIVAAVTGLAVFLLSYDGGTYGLVARCTAAIVLLWGAVVLVALGIVPARRVGRAAVVAGWLLAAFAAFTLLSAAWAPSAELAFEEFDRVVLLLAVFVVISLVATAVDRARIADGMACGIVAVGLLALGSRFFPHQIGSDATTLLPAVRARLNYPLGYWNGLGVLLALAVPLLLRIAVSGRRAAAALAVGAVPALGAALYLTASRGAALAVLVGVVAFLVFAERRVVGLAALAAGAVGTAVAVAVLRAQRGIVDVPLRGSAHGSTGLETAVLLALVCVVTGAVFALVHGAATRHADSRRIVLAAVLGALALAVATLVAVHPVRRIHDFTRAPASGSSDLVENHLLSSSGNGRWQFWTAAVDEFRTQPLRGRGAGSFEPWWAQHGSLPDFVRNAHSLYLETLGELGIVGLALLVGAFLVGIVAGLRALRGRDRTAQAALVAAFLAFATAAALDWIWQLAAVAAVGIACLALLSTATEGPPARPRARLRVAVALAGAALVVMQAIPLVSRLRLDASEAAVQRGHTNAALHDALAARDVEPWAVSPYLQLALVTEQAGELANARGWIREALRRDDEDWRLWLVASRIEAKQGDVAAAAHSLAEAIALNPRSPLFRS
jgi:hypothetical protein